MTNTDKEKAVAKSVSDLKTRYGDSGIMTGDEFIEYERELATRGSISSGSLALDRIIGKVRGIPRGKTTIIAGWNSAGKSTLTQHFIGNAQKQGRVALIDVEHSLDPAWAAKCGVDVRKLIVSQPDTGEQALQIAETLIRSGEFSAVVLDSIAQLSPRAELEGEVGDAQMMQIARLMSQAERMLTGIIKKTNTAMVFTNQYRNTTPPPGWKPQFGVPKILPGGKAQLFWASLIIEIRRSKSKSTQDFAHVVAKITKNKIGGREDAEAAYRLYYDRGIDKVFDVFKIAIDDKIIEQRGGGNFYYGGQHWRGEESTLKAMADNAELLAEIEGKVRDGSV